MPTEPETTGAGVPAQDTDERDAAPSPAAAHQAPPIDLTPSSCRRGAACLGPQVRA